MDTTAQVASNMIANPTYYREVLTIIFYTLGIISILVVAVKYFVKSELSSIKADITNLKEENMKRSDELEKIFDILTEIRGKLISREDLGNMISTKLGDHKDTCNLRNYYKTANLTNIVKENQ